MAVFVPKIGVHIQLNSGKHVELFENDIVHNLVYRDRDTEKVISGSVRVLEAVTKENSSKATDCPPEPYIQKFVNVNSMIIDSSTEFDAELTRIAMANVIDIESVEADGGAIIVGAGPQFKPLVEVIKDAPAGSTIELMEGVYTDDLVLNKYISIIGTGGSVFTGSIKINGVPTTRTTNGTEALAVYFDGLHFTANAKIELSNVDQFTMHNCQFYGHNLAVKSIPIMIKTNNPMELHIDDNVFGEQNEFSYNLIEVYGTLKDGSTISGNRFEANCCTNNQIALYNVEDDATIVISDNFCQKSQNMVRLGFKGEPKCTVNIMDNEYIENISTPEWEGLVLIQPYGKDTVSFAGMTVHINDTKKPEGQLCYMYNGANDMQFNDTNKPTVYIDGVLAEIPVVS